MESVAAGRARVALRWRVAGLSVLLLVSSGGPGVAAGQEQPEAVEGSRPNEPSVKRAVALMSEFAERTGLTSERPPRRYLWTDAFAVCNYLGLARATGDERHRDSALRLIDQVHHTLGRHRNDDPMEGWISGLAEEEGQEHPTRGGLRIGKELPERRPDQPFDERLEWERDGQYFHYLTKWMMALDLAARSTGDARYSRWALELAEAAFDGFVYRASGGPPRMVWKMSIDLSRPLVPSMGHHDPLDGLVTYRQVVQGAAVLGVEDGSRLEPAIEAFATMLRGQDLATADPLGLGGLLMDAGRISQLQGGGKAGEGELLERVLVASQRGLERSALELDLSLPGSRRLAFRELGLAIGLSAVERLQGQLADGARPDRAAGSRSSIEGLARFLSLRGRIVDFWLEPANREASTWRDHRDINEVMLATALVPDGCLSLAPGER